MKDLHKADLSGKKVIYHPDYSVPLKDGEIQDDYRIISTFPTLDFLIEKGAKIIIATKVGDPKGKVVPELSTRPIAQYLADHYPDHVVRLANEIASPEVTAAIEEMQAGDMIVLPNLRFYPGEQEKSEEFAKQLADLGEVYVNDAFAVDHRADASLVQTPKLMPDRYPGFLLEKELEHLGSLTKKPATPFVVVMGGAKVSDKIEVVRKLGKVADTILVGGAMANTFLLAKGEDISDSLAEADKVDLAKALMEEFGEKLVLAVDYVKDTEEGPKFRYLDIGEKSVAQFKEYLSKAKTVFWNGSLGFTEDEKYMKASKEIAEHIASLKGVTSIIAGGDTVETITHLNMRDAFTFVSTGGGAALEFLAGDELPGVRALEE